MSLLEARPRPPSSSSSAPCPRHHVTGLCAACLRERLSLLESENSTHQNSGNGPALPRARSAAASEASTLRRSKSFSVQNDGIPVVSEPQRRSCDVRVRNFNPLGYIFQPLGDECGSTVSGGIAGVGDGRGSTVSRGGVVDAGAVKPENPVLQQEAGNGRGSTVLGGDAGEGDARWSGSTVSGGDAGEGDGSGSTVLGGSAADAKAVKLENSVIQRGDFDGRESGVSASSAVDGGGVSSGVLEGRGEIEEEEEEEEEEGVGFGVGVAGRRDFEELGLKKMKDHIDSDAKKNPGSEKGSSAIGSFRLAASAFGKKLQKWRGKKKVSGGGSAEGIGGRDGKPGNWRRPQDAQSEVADYGYCRRSCDTELPRFSLDAGRLSTDGPRRSFDNPRASWDGFLIGGRAMYRMPVMMGAVVEDCPVEIGRSDNKIPVEEPMNLVTEDPEIPGGSMQTREYYLDSSSSQRRRRSFERSRSVRKAVGAVSDETKSGSNSKVSPAITDYLHRNRIADSRAPSLHSNSLRDDRSESFESVYRDISASKSGSKKWWSKSWSIWGLIHRRSSSGKDDSIGNEDGQNQRGNVVERSMSETWRGEANGDFRGLFDRKSLRSNSTACARNSFSYNTYGTARNGGGESKLNGLKRNQSARYSSSTVDSKLSQQNSSHWKSSRSGGLGKSGSMKSDSSAKNGLWMF